MKDSVGQTDDAALVQRLQARDKRAMEDLLSRHGSKLYGVALRIVRNETEAAETMQDALITIWNKVGLFEGRSAFTTWLYRVTANAALMRLRRNKRFEQDVPLDQTDADKDLPALQWADERAEPPSTTVLRGELGDRVRAAIDALPEPYRATVVLSDVEDMTLAEVAEATGASVAAVKSRLHRARLALRKELLPYLKDQPR